MALTQLLRSRFVRVLVLGSSVPIVHKAVCMVVQMVHVCRWSHQGNMCRHGCICMSTPVRLKRIPIRCVAPVPLVGCAYGVPSYYHSERYSSQSRSKIVLALIDCTCSLSRRVLSRQNSSSDGESMPESGSCRWYPRSSF
jgi:hypothetical protein